jgi:hypothetical protein
MLLPAIYGKREKTEFQSKLKSYEHFVLAKFRPLELPQTSPHTVAAGDLEFLL